MISDLDRLEIALRRSALASESVAYVGFRGFGSGGWFAGCRIDAGEDGLVEVDASSPVDAAEELSDTLTRRLTAAAEQAEKHARQLRARIS